MGYIRSIKGTIQRQRGYGQNGFEIAVHVSFDAIEFNRIKKTSNPLQAGMAQIKNVVLDATGIRGIPSYSAPSMNQKFPRAKKGLVTLTIYFEVNEYALEHLKVDTKQYSVYHGVNLQQALDATRNDGHLFAKTAIASRLGH